MLNIGSRTEGVWVRARLRLVPLRFLAFSRFDPAHIATRELKNENVQLVMASMIAYSITITTVKLLLLLLLGRIFDVTIFRT